MHSFAKATLIVVLLATFAGPATAANTSTATNGSTAPTGTYVSQDVRLVESGYNESSGEAYVDLRSTSTVTVTISDGGALSEGSGEIASRTVILEPNETTRLVIPATESNGRVAVVIDTPNVLYGHIINEESAIVGGSFTAQDAQITAAAAGLSTAIVAIFMVIRYLRGTSHKPERIA